MELKHNDTAQNSTPVAPLIERRTVASNVVELRIANPPEHALTLALCTALKRVLCDLAEAEGPAPDLILRASGGAFLNDALTTSYDAPLDLAQGLHDVCASLARYPGRVACWIEGRAVGGAFALALACDLRMCAAAARLGFPEAQFDLPPLAEGTRRLAEKIGVEPALEAIFAARLFDANTARDLGLVDAITQTPVETALALFARASDGHARARAQSAADLATARRRARARVHPYKATYQTAIIDAQDAMALLPEEARAALDLALFEDLAARASAQAALRGARVVAQAQQRQRRWQANLPPQRQPVRLGLWGEGRASAALALLAARAKTPCRWASESETARAARFQNWLEEHAPETATPLKGARRLSLTQDLIFAATPWPQPQSGQKPRVLALGDTASADLPRLILSENLKLAEIVSPTALTDHDMGLLAHIFTPFGVTVVVSRTSTSMLTSLSAALYHLSTHAPLETDTPFARKIAGTAQRGQRPPPPHQPPRHWLAGLANTVYEGLAAGHNAETIDLISILGADFSAASGGLAHVILAEDAAQWCAEAQACAPLDPFWQPGPALIRAAQHAHSRRVSALSLG